MLYLKEAPLSHDATAWARKQTTGSGTAKFVLMLLADQAGSDYSCWPSLAYLAGISELGESTIRSATKKLAELGLIRVYYRHRGNGLRRSSRYQLLIDGPETEAPDADDWSSYRQIPAADDRSEPAEEPLGASGSERSERAVIPYKEPSSNEPSALNPGASRTARATRIPDDFYPTPEMQEWFRQQGFVDLVANPRMEHEKFCDYWGAKAGADARKVDWVKTWRNWMREAAERNRRRGHSYSGGGSFQDKPSTTDMRVAQGLALAEKFRKIEEDQ